MSILHRVRRFESDLTRAVERRAREWSQSGAREPLEIAQAIVDTVAARLEPAARGRYVFPYNRLLVSIVAASRDERARFAAVLDSEPTLRDRIAVRLRDAGCDAGDVQIVVSFVARPAAAWRTSEYHVDCSRVAHAQAAAPAPPPTPQAVRDLHMTIVHGTAEQATYVFSLPRVNLGRCAEVRDGLSRLVRTNHVAFVDLAGTANHSVSRRHAHIEYVEGGRRAHAGPAVASARRASAPGEAGHYRIWDDRSAQGTCVVRNGRTVTVPAGSRGIRLESGDELILGEARVRLQIP
jgi:hypothetical protein